MNNTQTENMLRHLSRIAGSNAAILQELKEMKDSLEIVKAEAEAQQRMRKAAFDLHRPELERLGGQILEQIAKDKGWDKEIKRSG